MIPATYRIESNVKGEPLVIFVVEDLTKVGQTRERGVHAETLFWARDHDRPRTVGLTERYAEHLLDHHAAVCVACDELTDRGYVYVEPELPF